MFQKRRDTVGEFGVGCLFPEMTPRQPGPTSGLKVCFTNDRGRCDRSADFANSVRRFVRHGVATAIATPPAHTPGAKLEKLTKIIGALPLSARLPHAPPGDTSMDSVAQTRCGKLHGRPS